MVCWLARCSAAACLAAGCVCWVVSLCWCFVAFGGRVSGSVVFAALAAALAVARQVPRVPIGARWSRGRGRAERGIGARLKARDEPRAVPVVLDADVRVRARHAKERGLRAQTQVGGHPLPIQQVLRQGARHGRRPTGQIVQEVDHHHGRCVRVRLVQLEERAFNGQRVARGLSHAIASARSRGVSCACSG